MYKAIYASARDLAEEGLDAALGRIRETGVNTITLAATDHANQLPRRRGGDGELSSAAHGMVCFRARPERYGHIKPQVDVMVRELDPLGALERVAPDLRRAAWVAGGHNALLGERHPEYVSRNAFGEPYLHRPCPAHPAVRDYVVNLCSDLAHGYDLAAVVLETPGWLPCDQGYHAEFAAVPLDRWARTLLSWCFADTTRHAAKAAGVDAERLRSQVRELLEGYAADRPAGMAAAWWFADLVRQPEWAAFLDWRCRQVADLVTDVKAALPAGTVLNVIPSGQGPGAYRLEGSDLGMLATAADALEIPCYRAKDVHLDAQDARRRAGDGAALNVILRPGPQDLENGDPTVQAVRRLKQIGIAGIAFYDYEHIRVAGGAPVKAALQALEGRHHATPAALADHQP